MCGIAGVLAARGAEPPGAGELARMVAVLTHRGPDGWGLYRDGRVGLAHARLSIVGLTGGFQPLANEDRTVWISFNGEIFNHVELRAELEAYGHRFRTRTDTEVIVHAYEQWGEGAWLRFNGQFAFALWDARAGTLWLVRDRLGILPLFLARSGRHLAFASEAKALFAGGRIEPRFDAARLAQVFSHWSVAPHGSVFAGVEAVPAATALRIGADLGISARRYWAPDLAGDAGRARLTLDEAADRLDEHLTAAVRLRLRADVPVGVYISGGLDSAVIAALARRHATGRVHSFGVRFDDPAFDETAGQRQVAAHVGSEHHDIACGPADIAAALPDVVWYAETPLLRTAPAPLFLLSRLVRETGIRVVLSGEGADEWFAGYDIFKEDRVRRFWARRPDSGLRPQLLGRIHPFAALAGDRSGRLWQAFFRRGLEATDDPFYAHRIRWANTAWTQRLLSADLRATAQADDPEATLLDRMPAGWQSWTPLARAQVAEVEAFLSPYLLASQGDRVAMAHGVEARFPFLDPALVDFAGGLPDRVKMLGLRDKLVLRRLAARLLPAEVGRRPKRPYRAPMTTALFAAGAPSFVGELLSAEAVARHGLLDPEATAALVARARRQQGRMAGEREEMALVGALTLQMLAEAMGDGRAGRQEEAGRRLDRIPCHVLETAVPQTFLRPPSHRPPSRHANGSSPPC